MVRMWPPGGGVPVEVREDRVEFMKKQGWTTKLPAATSKGGK